MDAAAVVGERLRRPTSLEQRVYGVAAGGALRPVAENDGQTGPIELVGALDDLDVWDVDGRWDRAAMWGREIACGGAKAIPAAKMLSYSGDW